MTRRTLSRALAVAALGLAVVSVVGAGAGVYWLRTPGGNAWLLGTVLDLAAPARGSLVAAGLHTDLLHSLVLDDVELVDEDGTVLVHADAIRLDFELGGIFGRHLVVRSATLSGGEVHLRDDAGGCRNPVALWDASEGPGAPWTGLGVDIDLLSLVVGVDTIEACVGADPLLASSLTLTGSARLSGPRVTSEGLHLEGVLSGPAWAAEPTPFGVDTSGDWDGRLAHVRQVDAFFGLQHLRAGGDLYGLDGPAPTGAIEILAAHFEPEPLGIPELHGPFDATGTVRGALLHPFAQLTVLAPGSEPSGAITVTADLDVQGDVPLWNADILIPEDVQLGGTIASLRDTRVRGHLGAAGQGLGWPDDLHVDATADLFATTVEGQGPYRVVGPIALDHGQVDAPSFSLESPAGTAQVSLHVDLLASTAAVGVLDTDIDLAMLSAYGVPGLRGRVHFSGSVAGDWVGGVHASAQGAIRGARVGYVGTVSAASVAGPVHVGWSVDHGAIAGQLHLGGLSVSDTVRATAADAVVALEVSPAGLAGRVDARVTDASVPTQHYELLVANALLEPGAVSFAAIGGAAAPEGTPDGLPSDETLSAQGRYVFDGTLTLEQARVSPAPGIDWKLSDPATLAIRDDRFLVHAHAVSLDGRGSVVADGTLRTQGACDLEATLNGFPLATVNAFVDGLGLGGTVDAHVRLGGPLRAPVATFDVEGTNVTVPGAITGADIAVVGSSDGRRVSLNGTARETRAETTLVRLAASAGLRPWGDLPDLDPEAPMTLTLTLPPSDSQQWQEVIDPAAWPAGLPDVRVAAEVGIAGTVRQPTARLVAGAQVRSTAGWVSVDVDGTVVDDVATVRAVANQQLTRRAEVAGTLGLKLTDVARVAQGDGLPDLAGLISELSLDVVPLQLPLTALGAPANVKGSLLGGLHVSGDPARPKVEGALMVINGALGDVAVSPAMVTLTGVEAGYEVDAQLVFGGGGGVRAHGFVPVQANLRALDAELGREGLDLAVDGDGIPLQAASALIPGLSEAQGLAKFGGRITGRLSAPDPDITFALQNGSFTVDPLNVHYSTVNLDGRLTADWLVVRNLEAITSGRSRELNVQRTGTLHAYAELALDHFQPGALSGGLDLSNAWVANRNDVSLRATSALRLSGSWPQVVVAGRVDVDDANVVLGESFFNAESSLKLDDDILVIRPGVTQAEREEATAAVDLDLDVHIYLNRHADVDVTIPMEQFGGELTKSLSNLRFAGVLDTPDDLHLQRHNGVVQLSGTVEPVSGVANVLGKNFDLAGGQVSFTGVDYLSPLLIGVSAVYVSAGYGNITAHIAGPAQSPSISFSSDQGKSLDDMISILLFGAPVNELQDQSGTAIQAAFQSIFRSQMNEATSLTRLDVLELSSEGAAFGKRFGKDVLVEVVVNPNAATSTTLANPVELRVQVPLWKGWYLEGSAGTAGLGGLSAYSRWRF